MMDYDKRLAQLMAAHQSLIMRENEAESLGMAFLADTNIRY
jgi:4-O-beta-D-mannosyl-D-glucose phosphorylase